jgi:hypothetical protein
MDTPVGSMFLDPVFGVGGSLLETGSFDPEMERTLANELQNNMVRGWLGRRGVSSQQFERHSSGPQVSY